MSKAGFSWQHRLTPFSVKPSTQAVNTYIPTNSVPAKNAYRFKVHDLEFPKRTSSDYHVSRSELGTAYDKVVLLPGENIKADVMYREITRGTQKGFKTCTFGPHRPQMDFVAPNVNKDTGVFKRKPVGFEDGDLGAVSNEKYNIVASTFRGGFQPTATRLGVDLDGPEQSALIDFKSTLYTESKEIGGSSKGGGRAGFDFQKRKTQSAAI